MHVQRRGVCSLILITALRLLSLSWLLFGESIESSHLVGFDKSIASSLFGEPVFRLEPPNVIKFSSAQGATLLCLASGSPKPTISWFTSPIGSDLREQNSLAGGDVPVDINTNANSNFNNNNEEYSYNKPVTNITNLRLILQDGAAIRLLPFDEGQFRRDIHLADYRCVASNSVASIHSKSVSVQAGK